MEDKAKEDFYDGVFWGMITKLDGGVYEFLDLVLGFLKRKTGKNEFNLSFFLFAISWPWRHFWNDFHCK